MMITSLLLLAFQHQPCPFDYDQFLEMPSINGVAAGKQGVIVEVGQTNVEYDEYFTQLYHLREDAWMPITDGERGESAPAWSPDGETLAYLRDSLLGKGRMEVALWSFGEEGEPAFSWKGDIQEFAWAPDGKRMAFIGVSTRHRRHAAKRQSEPYVVDRLSWQADGDGPDMGLRAHLYTVELDTGAVEQLTEGDFDHSELEWSPDGTQIAFVSSRGDHRYESYDSDVYVMPAGGGEAKRITSGRTEEFSPVWSPDGKRIAYSGTTIADTDGAGVYLWVVDADGENRVSVTETLDRSLSEDLASAVWTAAGELTCIIEDGGGQRMVTAQADGTILSDTRLDAQVFLTHIGPDGKAFVGSSTASRPPHLYRWESYASRTQERDYGTAIAWADNCQFPDAKRFVVKSFDGLEIEAWYLMPMLVDGPLRTIVHVHGGPQARFWEGFDPEHQLWVNQGYAVLYANIRGSTGYGQEFTTRLAGRYGDEDYRDLMAVIDHAVAELGVDESILYLTGYSYGGMMTNWAVTQTQRFRAAVSGAGLSNYYACYGTDDSLLAWESDIGSPLERAAAYNELSPALYADQVETPILFLHGAEDVRCPTEQSIHYYSLLKRKGVDTRLVLYPEEAHDFSAYPSHSRDYQVRLIEWFQAH